MEHYNTLQLLTPRQRLAAKREAARAVAEIEGIEPKIEQFESMGYSKFPAWVVNGVLGLCVVMLLSAFFPSASRLFQIGSTTFQHGINDSRTAFIVGICVVMLSETGALLFTLALAVIAEKPIVRGILVASIIACAIIALTGNYEIAIWHKNEVTFFTYLEALLPPIMTLSTAYVLKEIALSAIERRYKIYLAFNAAHERWELANHNAVHHPAFAQTYANYIKAAVYRLNKKQREMLDRWNDTQWSLLVNKIMNEDDWFKAAVKEVEAPVVASPLPVLEVSASGNGAHP